MDRIAVRVEATDPISQAGVVAQLRATPDVYVVDGVDVGEEAVSLVVVDEINEAAIRLLRSAAHGCASHTVLVATKLDDVALVKAVEAGVVGVVLRHQATTSNLTSAIAAAARGDGVVPPDLLGRLLLQVGRLQRQVLEPRGLTFMGMSEREVDVLRLVADGYDTAEIADRLAYSERTVKNVLHDVTSRMHLRNRSQAVAYAIREGII